MIEWVSVKDRLPEPSERVLVSNCDYIATGWFENGSWEVGDVGDIFNGGWGVEPEDITHWSEANTPPKE